MPESNMIFDLFGCFLWMRILPGGVAVYFAIHLEAIVAGFAFPGADSARIAVLQEKQN